MSKTVTLSDDDLAALWAIRQIAADTQHPARPAAIAALDRIAASPADGQAPVAEPRIQFDPGAKAWRSISFGRVRPGPTSRSSGPPSVRQSADRDSRSSADPVRTAIPDQLGCDTGRRRYRVECVSCAVVVHEATTGPRWNVGFHVREADRVVGALC